MIQVQEIEGLRADGGIMQFWTELFKHLLNKTAGVSLSRDFLDRNLVLFCFISLILLRFTYHKYIEFIYCLR